MPGDSSVLMVVILRDGALVGTEAFPPGNYRVGSGDDCDLHLDDAQVSPLHASILFADGQVGIADEGGQGGVFVNGEPVQNSQVSSLDEVRVGGHVMKMRVVTKRKPAAAPAGPVRTPQQPIAAAPPAARAPAPMAAAPAPPAVAPVPKPAAPSVTAPRKRLPTRPVPAVAAAKAAAPTMLTPRPIPRPSELQSGTPTQRPVQALNATVPSTRPVSPPPPAAPAWPATPPRANSGAAVPEARQERPRPARARAEPAADPFGPPDAFVALEARTAEPPRHEPPHAEPPKPAIAVPVPKSKRSKKKGAQRVQDKASDHAAIIAAPHPGKAPAHPVLHARIVWGDTVVLAKSFRAGESVVVGPGEGYPLPVYSFPSPKAQRLARYTRKGWAVFLPADLEASGRQTGPWRPLAVERNAKGKANVVLEKGQSVRLKHGGVAVELRSEMPAPQIPFSWRTVQKHFDRTMVIPAAVGMLLVTAVITLVPKQSDRPDFTPKAMPAIRAILQPPKKKEEKKIEKPKEKTETAAKEEKPVKNQRLPPTKIVKHTPTPVPPQSAAMVAVSKLMNQGAAKNQLFAAVEKLGGERGKGGNLNYKSSGLLGKMPLAMNGVGGFGIGGGFGNGMGLTKGAGSFGGLRGLGGPGALSAGGTGHRGVGGAVVSAPARAGKVSGLLPMEAVRKVVDEHINEVRQCYESGLIRNPGVVGKVVLEWTIGTSGTVTQVKTKSATLDSPPIVNCILDRLKGWRFPAPKGGVVVVSYPFLFNSVGN